MPIWTGDFMLILKCLSKYLNAYICLENDAVNSPIYYLDAETRSFLKLKNLLLLYKYVELGSKIYY